MIVLSTFWKNSFYLSCDECGLIVMDGRHGTHIYECKCGAQIIISYNRHEMTTYVYKPGDNYTIGDEPSHRVRE